MSLIQMNQSSLLNMPTKVNGLVDISPLLRNRSCTSYSNLSGKSHLKAAALAQPSFAQFESITMNPNKSLLT